MSEEIKALFPEGVETLTISKDDYDRLYGQLTYENIILQQKVEQLEKENEQLQIQVNAYENPDDLTLFYMWLDEKAKDKIKQLENIRKEAIEECKSVIGNPEHTIVSKNELMKIMLNILNKGSDK